MKIRTKNVRVTVNSRPITNLSTGVIFSHGTYATLTLDESDIFKCICGKAIVEEVMPDGSFKKLDLFNYNIYNNNINDNDEPKSSVHGSVKKKENGEAWPADQTHELINPNIAPVNPKRLVNPSATDARIAEGQANLVHSLDEHGNSVAKHEVEEVTECSNLQTTSPKDYKKKS